MRPGSSQKNWENTLEVNVFTSIWTSFIQAPSAQRTTVIPVNDETYPVGPEDFLAKPAGKNIAHTFYNSGRENLYILDLGTVDPEDTCYYPDEHMYLHKSNGERITYRAHAAVNDWS